MQPWAATPEWDVDVHATWYFMARQHRATQPRQPMIVRDGRLERPAVQLGALAQTPRCRRVGRHGRRTRTFGGDGGICHRSVLLGR
ncbi:MAG: hypothetical protein RL701_3579 [Pseudomonadota bacterium]